MAQQIVTKLVVKHPWGKGRRWWCAPRGLRGGVQ